MNNKKLEIPFPKLLQELVNWNPYKKKMKVYFAHPINTYNTFVERYAINYLKEAFEDYEIINPKDIFDAEAYKIQGMSFFEEIVKKCDILVFLPFEDYKIGAGVYKEAQVALDSGLLVYLLKFDGLHKIIDFKNSKNILTVEETRERLKKMI